MDKKNANTGDQNNKDDRKKKELIKDRAGKFKELGFDDEQFVQELFELIMKKTREVQG